MGGWRLRSEPFARSQPDGPNGPPVPVSGTVDYDNTEVILNFDCQLTPEALSPAEWYATGRKYNLNILSAQAIGSRVVFAVSPQPGIWPIPRIRYSATPPDLRSLGGVYALPFPWFPLSVIP